MIPNDCLIVKPKKDVATFTHLTWNSNGCPKAIPLDIYELNTYRLDVVEDPHNLLPKTEIVPEEKVEPPKEVRSTFERPKEKVKASGKSKNKKR